MLELEGGLIPAVNVDQRNWAAFRERQRGFLEVLLHCLTVAAPGLVKFGHDSAFLHEGIQVFLAFKVHDVGIHNRI